LILPACGPLLILLSLFGLTAHAKPVRIQAPAELAQLITQNLDTKDVGDDALARAGHIRRLQKEIPPLVATEGYFSAEVRLTEEDGQAGIVVIPGVRFAIGEVTVGIDGPIGAERRKKLLDGWGLKTGAPFRQAAWDSAKQALLRQLLAEDHLQATLDSSEAEVDLDAGKVALSVSYVTGPRFRFGAVQVVGLDRYPPGLVERYASAIVPGAPYVEAKIQTLQTELQNLPYFSSVRVELVPATGADPEGDITAPVVVTVQERPPHELGFGVGYSSNTGARVEVSFKSADLFQRAWELNGSARLEQLKQSGFADVFLPRNRDNSRNSFGGLVEHSDIQGLVIQRVAVAANQTRNYGALDLRVALNWQNENKQPSGAESTINQALTLNAGWIWRTGTAPGDPEIGHVTELQVGGAAKALLSDQDFIRFYARYTTTLRLAPADTLMLRAEAGVTRAASRAGIPEDFLFRAGGTNSVRGYAYQSLGVKEGDATVGGRYLTTLSAEYTHWIKGPWGAAAFVDAGTASDDRQEMKLAVGYGVGVRWRSPVGAVGAYVAYGQRTGETRLDLAVTVPF
jgi:translocation and assembly module TamA